MCCAALTPAVVSLLGMPGARQNIRVGAAGVVVRHGAVLLIEFHDDTGTHYNLPGGGVHEGETLREAAAREVLEEASVEVEVGRFLLAWEYAPKRVSEKYGPQAKVVFVFECHLKAGQEPRLPAQPDLNQIGVRWVPLEELHQVSLLPEIAHELTQVLTQHTLQDLHEIRR